jgi:histidine triad (HIT) family protein
MQYDYDTDNIFSKIIEGKIPCKKILEDEFFLSFYDISPQAKIHALVIPKGPYLTYDHFINTASFEKIIGFHHGVLKTIDVLNIREAGYRLIANAGNHGGQMVPHYHVHILAGEKLTDSLNG